MGPLGTFAGSGPRALSVPDEGGYVAPDRFASTSGGRPCLISRRSPDAAVTVADLERSTRWYTALFGSEPVLDEDEQGGAFHHTVYALSGGQLFGLHTHVEPAAGSFDEHRTGLDHVSFACSGRGELQQWADRLESWGFPTVASRTRRTAPGSRSAIPTASRWSSSRHPASSNSRTRRR